MRLAQISDSVGCSVNDLNGLCCDPGSLGFELNVGESAGRFLDVEEGFSWIRTAMDAKG